MENTLGVVLATERIDMIPVVQGHGTDKEVRMARHLRDMVLEATGGLGERAALKLPRRMSTDKLSLEKLRIDINSDLMPHHQPARPVVMVQDMVAAHQVHMEIAVAVDMERTGRTDN